MGAIVVESSLDSNREDESPITKREGFGERKCVTWQVLSNDKNLPTTEVLKPLMDDHLVAAA